MFKNLGCFLMVALTLGVASARERDPQTARVVLQLGKAGCLVDLDAGAAAPTDGAGTLTISEVEPGDHYVHVACTGEPEAVFFISPKARDEIKLGPLAEVVRPS